MSTCRSGSLALLAATALATASTLFTALPAAADDTELFIGEAVAPPTARPNIMFILDTSGSMDGEVQSQAPFDPSEDWGSHYQDNRIYWKLDNQTLPPCEDDDDEEDWDGDGIDDCDNDQDNQYIDDEAFTCAVAMSSLKNTGIAVVAKVGMWRDSSGTSNDRWDILREDGHDDDDYVECSADEGVHGRTTTSSNKWAANGSNGAWSGSKSARIDWATAGQSLVTFYTGNYLNWARSPFVTRTRFEIVQEAAKNLLDNMADNVNVGLMRYSNDSDSTAEGGMVIHPIEAIENARGPMKTAIDGWVPDGFTPLSETLYEAHQYFTGGDVAWGRTSDRFTGSPNGDTPSTGAACVSGSCTPVGSKYKGPMTQSCQRNFIVFLTDGLPTRDKDNDDEIAKLIGHDCDKEDPADLQEADSGNCTDDLAQYMQENDLQAPKENGQQNVTSYWIGFGPDVARGSRFLQHVASGGGGGYYTAADTAELTEAFTEIVSRILSQTSMFTAPTVAINAFNRTQNLNYLYTAVFKPSQQYRWLGNIKKYRITPEGQIRDANGNLAVDPNTGFFFDDARRSWSAL
jgi:type IV pilus assembly protein PilY1